MPRRLFDNSGSCSLSPPLFSAVPPVNNRYTTFKKAATKKSSPILYDKCVLTPLRSSFVQTSIDKLKTGARKHAHFVHARQAAMNEFDISTYLKKKTVDPLGNRRSIRNIRSPDATDNTIELETSGGMNYVFDLSSRSIRRYIIEDIMFISVGKLVTLIVLNKRDTWLTVDFFAKGDDKCIDGVELKFSSFFLKDDLQMWGNKPMLQETPNRKFSDN